jgi:predicted nuclease of predicted toxin-antitoxin system
MFRLLIDEDFNNDILRGLLRRVQQLDVLRVQDAGLSGADDHRVLAWAADEDRIVVSHDSSTMSRFAYDRVALGAKMPGVFIAP